MFAFGTRNIKKAICNIIEGLFLHHFKSTFPIFKHFKMAKYLETKCIRHIFPFKSASLSRDGI